MRSWICALVASTAVLVCVRPAAAGEIDACKYLLVSEITPDPYDVTSALREQGKAHGFMVVTAPSEIPDADQFRTCVMVGRWLGGAISGQLAIRVVDSASGAPIAAASINATNWWGIGHTVRGGIDEIYRQVGYTGYKEDVYNARMQRLYPPRPKIALTEDQVRAKTPGTPIEGIWTDAGDQYRLAIVPAPADVMADYVAIVLKVNVPLWEPGEIKAEFTTTPTDGTFSSNYYALNKQAQPTMFVLQGDVLSAQVKTPTGDLPIALQRIWPEPKPTTPPPDNTSETPAPPSN
jgi:hypothetical protein